MTMLRSVPDVWVPGYEPAEAWHWDVDQATKMVWLEALLECPSEDEAADFALWLSIVRSSPQAVDPLRTGFSTVGIKMTEDAIHDHAWMIQLVRRTDTKIVFLERRNRAKHALSLYRSYEEQKNQFQFKGIQAPSTVDLDLFDEWLETARGWHERTETLRSQCTELLGTDRVLTVAYERFGDNEGKSGVVRTVCAFLGVDPSRPLEALEVATRGGEPFGPDGYYRKATADRLSDSVVNFDRLLEHYSGTDLEPQLKDD